MRDHERMAALNRNTLAIDATQGITSSPHFPSHMDFLNNTKLIFSPVRVLSNAIFENLFTAIKS